MVRFCDIKELSSIARIPESTLRAMAPGFTLWLSETPNGTRLASGVSITDKPRLATVLEVLEGVVRVQLDAHQTGWIRTEYLSEAKDLLNE